MSSAMFFFNRLSSGHLLTADAVLWDVPCALKGSICLIGSLWGIFSGRALCCLTYAVYSRDVVFKRRSFGHLLGADAVWSNVRCVHKGAIVSLVSWWEHNLRSFRCVAGRTLCTQGENVSTRRRVPSLENTAYVPQHSARHEEMPQGVSTRKLLPLGTQSTPHSTAFAMRGCSKECLLDEYVP